MPDDIAADVPPGGRQCATCMYAWGVKLGGQLLVRVECRRFPPQAGNEQGSYWFPVSPLEWCGEWREHPSQQG